LRQKGLIKMHDRVFLPGAPAEVGQNGSDIGAVEHRDRWSTIHTRRSSRSTPAIWLNRLGRKGLVWGHNNRPASGRKLAPCAAFGGEQPITNCLRVHVGKLFRHEIVEQDSVKALELEVQFPVSVFLLIGANDHISQQAGNFRHFRGQFIGTAQSNGLRGAKVSSRSVRQGNGRGTVLDDLCY